MDNPCGYADGLIRIKGMKAAARRRRERAERDALKLLGAYYQGVELGAGLIGDRAAADDVAHLRHHL
jgi:hypothetical protein